MKGVILAGGKGTRLNPLTCITNKHLLPVYNKPMVLYPMETLISMGVTDILIVSGGEYIGKFTEFLGNGSKFGVNLTYKVQEESGGIAEALGLAKDFAQGGSITVILGDNIFENKFIPKIDIDEKRAYMFVKKVENPERFGVISMIKDKYEGKKMIVEKPKEHIGDHAVVGLYIYPNDVFEIIPTLEKSDRGELEVTDLNNYYLSKDRGIINVIKGYWSDAGTMDSLFNSSSWAKNKFLLDK